MIVRALQIADSFHVNFVGESDVKHASMLEMWNGTSASDSHNGSLYFF